MTTTEQEYVTACLLAHVNLAGEHVAVSLRGAPAGLALEPGEASTYNCREGAFMGNLFAGHASDKLPMMQCHEYGATQGTGRLCDPAKESSLCWTDCSAACDQISGNITSCNITIDGVSKSYSNIITTFLPANPTTGCLGWGYKYNPATTTADYTSGPSANWRYHWSWSGGESNSCASTCGGYAPSGCSCTPDCASRGNCCSDYSSVCGIPPAWSGPTSGVSTCPTGYTRYTGTLNSTTTAQYWPSASGYTPTTIGTHHGTLLGPGTADYDLQLEKVSSGSWATRARSVRGSANESIHWFYAVENSTFRWKISWKSGSGGYTFCLKKPS
jgi:hypothetical protein